VEILLDVRGWQHEERTLEDRSQSLEGVRDHPKFPQRIADWFCSSTARIFFGRGAVMAKALGTTPEEEHRPGLHVLAKVRLLQVTP
jgi:hypothetical protein